MSEFDDLVQHYITEQAQRLARLASVLRIPPPPRLTGEQFIQHWRRHQRLTCYRQEPGA